MVMVMVLCPVQAQDTPATGTKIELADGNLIMQAPKEWKKGQPRFPTITQYEFSAPADAKSEAATARITVSSSRGSLDDNIERWYGQFTQPDGKSSKDAAKLEKFDVDGQTVHFVDLTGTYKESMGGGPFAPGKTVMREDYQMLGAIVVTKSGDQFFIKMTGPKEVCGKLSEGFKKMLKGLEAKS